MKKLCVGFVFMLASLLFAFSAMADTTNVRPNPAVPVLGGEAPDLATVFNNIGATTYAADPVNTQSNAAIFTNEASGGAIASFIIAVADNASSNESGLYKYGDETFQVPVFNGVTTGGLAQAAVSFLADGSVRVTDLVNGGSNTYAGFGNSFGFYLSGSNGTFYTEDSLNGGMAQALVYQGNGMDTITVPGLQPGTFATEEWIFAWEDLAYASSDRDFQDLVYIVESIRPVPEPAILLLVGAGLIGLGIIKRKS